MQPTSELYDSLQKAFDHFNRELFHEKLPSIIFTVQRKKGVMGYFAPDRWGNLSGKKCHEIAINPSYIANSRLIEVMQTLVHEMVHCWQYCFGSPGRNYYHNKEWAYKMIEVGLMPSTTGEPGGDITGQHMGDYIIEGGNFLKSFNSLKDNQQFQLSWIDRLALPRLFEPIIANMEQETSEHRLSMVSTNSEDDNLAIGNTSNTKVSAHSLEADEFSYSEIMPDTFFLDHSPKRKTRHRYICYGCYAKVYGRPNLNIRCEDCNQIFEHEEL
jgi:hypothetical protein